MREDFSAAMPPANDAASATATHIRFADPLAGPPPQPNTPEGFAALAVFAADWSSDQVTLAKPANDFLPDPAPLTATAALAQASFDAKAHDRSEGPGWFGCAAAAVWAGIAGGAPLAYWGAQALAAQHPALLAALAAVVVFPSVLILMGSSAARDAARARAEARRMAALAGGAFGHSDAPITAVEKFGAAVRTEIDALETVVERAMSRLSALEQATARSRQEFGRAVSDAEEGAKALTANFDREIGAFEQLNFDLRTQTEHMGQSVSRQVRLMREASRLVSQEVQNADEVIAQRLDDIAAVSAVLGEKAAEIGAAVDNANTGAQMLSASMGQSLEVLHGVAQVNDRARRQVNEAAEIAADAAMGVRETSLAANQAAQAVRDAAAQAVDDASRAAAAIRAEALSMTELAQATLGQLEAAAMAARDASAQAEAAAERQSANIQRRLASMSEAVRVAQQRPVAQAQAEAMRAAAASGRPAPAPAQSWSRPAPTPANDYPAAAPARRRAAIDLVVAAGLVIADVIRDIDLDRILARARFGEAARRRAVRELAPTAIERLAVHLARDEEARFQAQSLRRDAAPNLDTRPVRDSLAGDELAAWLLLDASLG
jgi:hypothetical protein